MIEEERGEERWEATQGEETGEVSLEGFLEGSLEVCSFWLFVHILIWQEVGTSTPTDYRAASEDTVSTGQYQMK